MRRISIAPANRFRRFVVITNVPADLSCEISDRREDAARQQVAFDLREPQLDLIQPRPVGRREMEPHVGMRDQERPYGLGLVRGEIVENHVDLATLRLTGHNLAEELDEGGARVPRHGQKHPSSFEYISTLLAQSRNRSSCARAGRVKGRCRLASRSSFRSVQFRSFYMLRTEMPSIAISRPHEAMNAETPLLLCHYKNAGCERRFLHGSPQPQNVRSRVDASPHPANLANKLLPLHA
jgi:hypothetical protein